MIKSEPTYQEWNEQRWPTSDSNEGRNGHD
jgi:hypothetical protein